MVTLAKTASTFAIQFALFANPTMKISKISTLEIEQQFAGFIYEWLIEKGVSEQFATLLKLGILLFVLSILLFLVDFFARKIILRVVHRVSQQTETEIDDILVREKVFDALAHVLPAIAIGALAPFVFADFPKLIGPIITLSNTIVVFIVMMVIRAFLNAMKVFLSNYKHFKDKPIASYTQLANLINYIVGGIIIFSLLFDRSPLYFISALGAASAILLLIFKDTLLGFVASIQMSTNDIVRIGDWVTMDKYGADGDIIEINLSTVKVQNFDNTITTIPTYAFISDSFRNWRGMTESHGRRIKRSINIKISSIKFCDEKMLEEFNRFEVLREYISEKQAEILEYNAARKVDKSLPINGRNQTNIGIFRKYVELVLLSNPNLNLNMTSMVRQLQPNEKGLPLEIYVFSAKKEWVPYEHIMADIFDHILAAVPYFYLEIHESPTGTDFKKLV